MLNEILLLNYKNVKKKNLHIHYQLKSRILI